MAVQSQNQQLRKNSNQGIPVLFAAMLFEGTLKPILVSINLLSVPEHATTASSVLHTNARQPNKAFLWAH